MAGKAVKQAVDVATDPETIRREISDEIVPDIEGLIADELLESINWQTVKTALINKAKQRFWDWLKEERQLTTVNLLPHPELAGLEEDRAA